MHDNPVVPLLLALSLILCAARPAGAAVVEDHVVDALAQATRAVLKEPLTPKTGIGFVIDVDRMFGMDT